MRFAHLLSASLLVALALAGCTARPQAGSIAEPAASTEAGAGVGSVSPERTVAIAAMRRDAAAGAAMPYPDVFQRDRNAVLATRPEPLSVARTEEIEAELMAIAEMRRSGVSAAEAADLDARERALRRLARSVYASPQPE